MSLKKLISEEWCRKSISSSVFDVSIRPSAVNYTLTPCHAMTLRRESAASVSV